MKIIVGFCTKFVVETEIELALPKYIKFESFFQLSFSEYLIQDQLSL